MTSKDSIPYDAIASGYNELHGAEQASKAAIIAEHLRVLRTDKVIDVGCGTGLGAQFIAGKAASIIGIDPSKELVKQCPFPAIVGTAENIPYDDKYFDIAICVSAVHNFDDIEAGLREIARVTKREAAITVLKKSAKAAMIEKKIRAIFIVKETLDNEHDTIFICKIREPASKMQKEEQ
jgi:ubiquinone/menaquinone biosynthesis C-methylase UbiE